MISEVDLYGLLVSPMLLWVGAALVVSTAIRHGLSRFGLYRYVWHRPLFDFALLIITLGGVVTVASLWLVR
jgi:hypothetical protein